MIPQDEWKALEGRASKGECRIADLRRLMVEIIVLRADVWNWKDACAAAQERAHERLETALIERDEARRLAIELYDNRLNMDSMLLSLAEATLRSWGTQS